MNLFLLIFFLLYGGTHLYFYLKVRAAFSFGTAPALCLALFLLAMVWAPILVRVAEKEGMESSARLVAYAGYLWMGFLFLFLSSSLVIDVYQGLIHGAGYLCTRGFPSLILSHRATFFIPLVWGVITASYGYLEARNIRTEHITLASPKIPEALGKLTIVQISDVHLGLIIRKERLITILDLVKAAAPDILVSTGDLVDGQINGLVGLAELLREVTPRYGKYAVTGNHELYAGFSHSVRFMESAGFKVLRGEEVTIPGVITIAGVDDPAIDRTVGSASQEEKRLMAGFPKDTFTLLLKHRPVILQASSGRFDLQLSGHVHKGQLFPFNLITYLFYPVRAGLNRHHQNSLLYVSRGSGTWGPPIRFLAPPEVTIIELVHSPSSE